jgi:hypothetical protein
VWGYGRGMNQRERTKTSLAVHAGIITSTPFDMAEKLASVPAGVEWVDMAKAKGGRPRVPVVLRDGRGGWWWMGLRSVFFTYGGERVSVGGRQATAQRRIMETDKRGEAWFWVVDFVRPEVGIVFSAPYILETWEDCRRYYALGVSGEHTPAKCAAALGWAGQAGTAAAEKLLELIFAVAGKRSPEILEKRRADMQEVRFPSSAAEIVEKRLSWRELAEVITRQGEAAETLRGEVETLRAEVATLRGLVI